MNKKLIIGITVCGIISLAIYSFLSVDNKKVYENEYQPKPNISPSKVTTKQPGYRESLYDTAWPADMANLNRSNAVVDAGLARNTVKEEVIVETVEMPFPVFSYTRNDDEVFVVGGSPFVLDKYVSKIDGLPKGKTKSEPHITKYNPKTGKQVRITLDRGKTVNYIGGALIHDNGYVYVIAQAHLYKIEPDTMTINKSVDLPTAAFPHGKMTIYNGLSTVSSGNIITKYWSITSDSSEFLSIDPDTLEIISTVQYSGASPRLTIAPTDGTEYLYHLNKLKTYRLSVNNKSLKLDNNWFSRFDPYNTGKAKNEEPTSPVIVNNRVYYTTNTTFKSKNPMKIFWQDTDKAYKLDGEPLSGEFLFEGAKDTGWSFFHLSIDEATGIIIGNDQANGLLTAIRIDDNGNVKRLWEKKLNVSARPAIVSDRQMVYATDYVNGHNDLVVLDLTTGEEMIRVTTPATRATISTIVVGTNNEVYFGSNEPGKDTGLFHRIYVREK